MKWGSDSSVDDMGVELVLIHRPRRTIGGRLSWVPPMRSTAAVVSLALVDVYSLRTSGPGAPAREGPTCTFDQIVDRGRMVDLLGEEQHALPRRRSGRPLG